MIRSPRLLLGAALHAAAAAFALPSSEPAAALQVQQRTEALVRAGFEWPEDALEGLQALRREPAISPKQRLRVLIAIGLVEARAGREADAEATARALTAAAQGELAALASAGADAVWAETAFTAGKSDVAARYAERILPALLATCPSGVTAAPSPSASLPAAAAVPDCEWRLAWSALRLLERHWQTAGVNANATANATASLRLVEWAGDTVRQSTILAVLSQLAEDRGDHEAADRFLLRARHVATQPPLPGEQAPIESSQATVLAARGDLDSALRFRERAVALATQANAPRLEAQMLTNLADTWSRLHRPAEALEAAEHALAIVRSRHDQRAERALINNAGIAKIALGRTAEGRQDLARVLELWRSSGELGRQAETLREFGEALAAAGEPREALALYHREREISDELMKADRAIALKELQTHNDAEARQRDIALLARENALQTEALANRDLLQVVWGLAAAVLLLACGLAGLFYRRVRRAHGQLAASHAELQSQSERDPLTNLANRRHCSAVMAALGAAPGGFAGALLLVDIDHFKRVNDRYGHSGGDRALVEVGQRLAAAVRAGDLVVRWGGEEFLILAPKATAEQAEQMAARILAGVGAVPVVAEGRALRVTVSVGHASFPLADGGAPLAWERAVEFADRALLAAKDGGRNRAIGIESTAAGPEVESLLASQAAFVAASLAGRIVLRETLGPPLPAEDRQAA